MTSTVECYPDMPDIVVRFAPSPNGLLHLGHAYAAMQAHDFARAHGGRFLLRIEDIDARRTRDEFVRAIYDDLRWLGLDWDGETIFQSPRMDSYVAAAKNLRARGLLYPCFCSRADIRAAHQVHKPQFGPDGPVYPGTCRHLDAGVAAERLENEPHSWRLESAKAIAATGPLTWHDAVAGEQGVDVGALGDVIIVPRDIPTSYHLAVTLDDARDAITHVVRGQDLFASTHVHRLLQSLLGLPTPTYVHHPVLLDETGEKLSKSRDSDSLKAMRESDVDGVRLCTRLRQSKLPVGMTLQTA